MIRLHLTFPQFVSSLFVASLALGPAACDKSSSDGEEGSDEDGDSDTDGEDEDGTGTDDSGGEDTGTSDPPGESGETCETGADCLSGKCYMSVVGSYCGECESDADCPDGGCSPPNPLSTPPQGSVCNMGELGEGCMSNEVCQSGICSPIITVAGEPISGCSECAMDKECTDGQLCSPVLDVANFRGHRTCVDAGSLADGEGCDFEGSGAEACMNYCSLTVDLGGAQIGVCGECNPEDHAGCEKGEICQRGRIDIAMQALVPAMCEPEK